MRTKKRFFKKFLSMQLVLIVVLAMIFSIIGVNNVQAKTYTQYTKTGISEFPEDYQTYLKKLSDLHPNWTFTAFYTGMTWDEFISSEISEHLRNTVHASSDASWKCSSGESASGYVCASEQIVEYFADPRNFLTESGIFQFLEMSYNSSIHTKEGVDSILSGTFMDKTINVSGGEVETEVNARQDDQYIIIAPNTKNSEVASTLRIDKYKVTDSNGKTVSNSSNAATGYIFTNTTYNTSYTMIVLGDVNGDGEIRATDYARIKNYIMEETTLTNIQKMAADVNEDENVKATDYARIKNYIMDATPITVKGKTTTSSTAMSYSEIIMKAAEESGISPYSIAIKIIQEVGRQGSNSVSGNYPGYEGYYNFFNIGAYDSGNAIENGLKYAKEKGWNSPYISIIEGSKYMADSYIGVGQNTAYFYKFDVVDDEKTGTFWHQYMTNVQDPSSQAKNLYNTYATNNMLDLSLNFIIPVFNDMPDVCSLPSSIDKNDPTSYYITGTGVRLRSSATVNSSPIATLELNEIVTVENINAGSADGYTWAKIKRSNGTTGYVASNYLKKCN